MAPYGGVYITHMRSEADDLLEATDEAIRIGKEGGVPVEIYHLKAAGKANWDKAAQRGRQDRQRPRRGARRPGRHVSVHGGWHRAERLLPAGGVGGRQAARAPGRPGRARDDQGGDAAADVELGEPLRPGGSRGRAAGRLQQGPQQEVGRQAPQRGRRRHGHRLGDGGHGPGAGRQLPRGDDLLPHARGQRADAAAAAVDQDRHRRRWHAPGQRQGPGPARPSRAPTAPIPRSWASTSGSSACSRWRTRSGR